MKAYVTYITSKCTASTFYDFKHLQPTEEELTDLIDSLRKENDVHEVIITGIIPLYDETEADDVKIVNSFATSGNVFHPENGVYLTLYNEDDKMNISDNVITHLNQSQARNLAKSLLRYAGEDGNPVKKINLNDTVKVKLTEYGKNIYRNHCNNISRFMCANGSPLEPPVDDDGYSGFQIHRLMDIFGVHVLLNRKQIFEKNAICLNTNDLEDITE